jgi:hypothetical protein
LIDSDLYILIYIDLTRGLVGLDKEKLAEQKKEKLATKTKERNRCYIKFVGRVGSFFFYEETFITFY